MAAVLNEQTEAAPGLLPVVIVGAGPVGVRVAQELVQRMPDRPVIIYGAEPWTPYNRVRLSSLLSGESDWLDISNGIALPQSDRIEERFGCKVVMIDREHGLVQDDTGRVQPFHRLVLATGSSAHVPNIPGIDLAGVFSFRNLDDAQQLSARQVRSRNTVVIGGGLLGLEAARAMQRHHTHVHVVEHYDRLMPRQLDEAASALLKKHVEASGIEVITQDGPAQVLGEGRVSGLRLMSGREIECDTVVVAAGIRPNIDIARRSGLSVGRGIRVDDRLNTTDPTIYAVGECAEHRGQVYGLVAPGLEQAAIVGHVIAGGDASYLGSTAATRLKVLRYPVFSMGEVAAEEVPDLSREYRYSDAEQGIYRKLVIKRGRLIGAIGLGEWAELARIQESVLHQRRVWPWQLWQFARTGRLWGEQAEHRVADWPASATVCNCTGVCRGQLSEALAGGCQSVADLAAKTGASSVCGSCKPLLQELVGSSAPREPVWGHVALYALAVFALLHGLAFGLLPAIPFPDTVDLVWRWDMLWRDGLFKQASGFTTLGLAVLLAVLGLRKRWQKFVFWQFDFWRVLHVAVGGLVVFVLLVHTGGRLGEQINLWLMLSMLGLTLSGAIAAVGIAREHQLDPVLARRLRTGSLWAHIFLLWPLPALLGFHVLKTYWF